MCLICEDGARVRQMDVVDDEQSESWDVNQQDSETPELCSCAAGLEP